MSHVRVFSCLYERLCVCEYVCTWHVNYIDIVLRSVRRFTHVCTFALIAHIYIYIYSADSMVLGSAVSLWLFLLGSRLSV